MRQLKKEYYLSFAVFFMLNSMVFGIYTIRVFLKGNRNPEVIGNLLIIICLIISAVSLYKRHKDNKK